MRVMVPHKTSEEQDMMFIFIYLYNVYQTKTDTASNLKRIEREQKKKKGGRGRRKGGRGGWKLSKSIGLRISTMLKTSRGRDSRGRRRCPSPLIPRGRQRAVGEGFWRVGGVRGQYRVAMRRSRITAGHTSFSGFFFFIIIFYFISLSIFSIFF